MSWDKVASAVKSVAPAIGRALEGSPAGAVVDLVTTVMGAQRSPDAVLEAIRANPAALTRLAELDAAVSRAAIADVQDARRAHAGHWMTWLLPLVSITIWIGLVVLMVIGNIPAEHREQYYFALGSWTTITSGGVAYWLGTSRGSAEKQQDLIRRM